MTSALESSIHMTLTVRACIKESVSHDSENGGNSYRWVGCRREAPDYPFPARLNHLPPALVVQQGSCLTLVS
ncbi:hypothetical protein EI067_31735 [Mycobacterium paragordonae]|nr:hypothetical protein EI067_31735 [Mycobacterium paragordonae]